MMTTMASRPRMVQGAGGAGGTGAGPQTGVQSWQEQGPEPSSRESEQAHVWLSMGVKPAVGPSGGRRDASRWSSGVVSICV